VVHGANLATLHAHQLLFIVAVAVQATQVLQVMVEEDARQFNLFAHQLHYQLFAFQKSVLALVLDVAGSQKNDQILFI
jgi:hypothetical protein